MKKVEKKKLLNITKKEEAIKKEKGTSIGCYQKKIKKRKKNI